MDDVELDNERHRREEQERRAKRNRNRETKSKSGHVSEKERKRREHAQRILGAQRKKHPSLQPEIRSSIFQSLFHERAEGFLIDLRFRNAPPRPPVGPTFVGLGLEGELTNKWTKYKARNAVETQYTWKLHPKRELGAQLAVSGMDYENCYTDRKRNDEIVGDDSLLGGDGKKNEKQHNMSSHVVPTLDIDDDALINWRGGIGDTAAEQLQQKQDRVRAAARLAIAQGYGAPVKVPNGTPNSNIIGGIGSCGSAFRLKKHHLKSRILDEKTPNFMKKTTYLTNDATSVHRFTSLAHTQVQRARDVDQALAEKKSQYSEMDMIEMGFKEANFWGNQVVASEDCTSRRIHPLKKDINSLWDLPILPDVETWGHTFTHVVVDNPPKKIGKNATKRAKKKNQANEITFNAKQLHKAVVADVAKQKQNSRMECTLWSSSYHCPKRMAAVSELSEPPAKVSRKGQMYVALQQYDLDVVPLRDPSVPPVHYVLVIDPSKRTVGYHSVGSRVHLSTGRPIVATGTVHIVDAAEMTNDKTFISRRTLGAGEKKHLERRIAEVDMDLAEKYDFVDEDEIGEKEIKNDIREGELERGEEIHGDVF